MSMGAEFPRWMSRRRAAMQTGMKWRELRPHLVAAGVDLFQVGRRELVDADGLARWMNSRRTPTPAEAQRVAISVRTRVRQRMAQRRAQRAAGA